MLILRWKKFVLFAFSFECCHNLRFALQTEVLSKILELNLCAVIDDKENESLVGVLHLMILWAALFHCSA